MAKSKRPKKGKAEPVSEAKPRWAAKRTNAELAYDFMRYVDGLGFAIWMEEHRNEMCAPRTFVYLLPKGEERTRTNHVPEHELYEFMGQWLVENATPKSRQETFNIHAELLWLLPKKKFANSTFCLPEAHS